MNLHPTLAPVPAVLFFFEVSRTVISTCTAGIVLFAIGLLAARNDVAEARGLDKLVALSNFCFAAPLAVFGAEHFAAASGIMQIVPSFMPWPLFWTYFVGLALVSAGLSIATQIQVQWSGLLFGIMMFLFVAMMDIPAALAKPHDRIAWALLLRELSFGSGGWILAGDAMAERGKGMLITIGRIVVGIGAIFYGVEHFLHPANVPGVPLEKLLPMWIPAHPLISYLTGVILVVCGAGILLGKKVHLAATYLGAWIVLLVVVVYGPILIASLMDASTDVKVEGINYFFDTLLYGGTILALAKATRASD
jgi:uncharacterized membrane protein